MKGCLGAEYPVQLDRVAARFVDLQGQLWAIQDERRHPAGALRRAEQGDGLLAHAPCISYQVPLLDELVAGCALVPTERVRVGPLLHLSLTHSRGHQAQTAFDDLLLDVAALGAGKGLALADKRHAGLGDGHAGHGTGLSVGCYEQRYFVVE